MHKWFEITFKVFNAQVWQVTVQVRHVYDARQAEHVARGIIKHLTLLEVIEVKEIENQVPQLLA